MQLPMESGMTPIKESTAPRSWMSSRRMTPRDDRSSGWAVNYLGRETNAELAEGGSAGRMRCERRNCCRSFVKNSVCVDECQCWEQIIDRQCRDGDCAGREVGSDVVKVSAVVDTLDPAGIDRACPRHGREHDHQSYEKPP